MEPKASGPPGEPFHDCVRGFIKTPGDVMKGFWCFVGEVLVFVPDDQVIRQT